MVFLAASSVSHVTDHITRMSIHSDHTHEFSSERLVNSRSSDHHNEAAEIVNLLFIAFLHGILITSLAIQESFLAVDNPQTVVQKQHDL
jgi:hypothetical protein